MASRGRSQQRRSGGGGGRRWFKRGRRKHCVFCADKSLQIDYKLVDMLRGFLTDRGKIQPRRRSGTCAKHQRQLSTAIKRARHLAMLPFVVEADRR